MCYFGDLPYFIFEFFKNKYIKGFFCKINLKLKKVSHKTNLCFFLTFHLLYLPPQVQIILKNAINFFFLSKMTFLLSQPHHLQVFTRLSLPSIHQPPWTTNLKLLMHLKIDLHSFFLNSYELKTTSLSLSLHIHPKKTKILILKFLWFIEPLKLTIIWWVTFVWDSGCLEKTYVW